MALPQAVEAPDGRGDATEAAAPSPAAASDEQQAGQWREVAKRDSEELNPLSLAHLFACDPECAAKNKERQQLSRALQFAGSQLDHELELKKLQVFVRIRPSVAAGAPHPGWEPENCVHATSKCSIAIAPPRGSQAYKSGDRGQTYSFSRVFDCDTSQQAYYEQTAAPLVRDLLRNKQHNSVMMAYGITAAGKTYTIEGTGEQPGVMPRALVELFEGLGSHAEPIVARASYYEVYNEQIYDLLEEQGPGLPLGPRPTLRLKEDTMGRVFVAGLSEVEVSSASEALDQLRRGSRQRQRAETGLNYSSSRSHSIFTVTLYHQGLAVHASEGTDGSDATDEKEAEAGEEKLGHISFVDLAGSERAQRTGNVGVRLKESVAINSSLMTLGRCLEALRWNQQHKGSTNLRVVPYRESKVTHLFRDALHGWGQVILSVNVSPVSKDYDETAHVLKYAALATQIGTIQQAEAPRRTIKAVSPAIKKVKRKAALPAEARGQGAKAKKAKKADPAAPTVTDLVAIPEETELAAEGTHGSEGSGPTGHAAVAPEGATSTGQTMDRLGEEAGEGKDMAAAEDSGGLGEVEAGTEDGELYDGEFGTPSTPLAEEDEASAALQAQVQQLIAELQKAEERCVLLEAEVREEVADEMAQLLRDMEESYRQRLEAEVAALEKKQPGRGAGAGAAEGGRRGKGRGGKAGKDEPTPDASALQLAAARGQAAQAIAEAEQLRHQAAAAAAQLEEAHQELAKLQEQAEQRQSQAAEHAAGLAAEVAGARQAAALAQEQLAAEHTRVAGLEAELVAVRQQADEAQASLATERQRTGSLDAELMAARQRAQEAQRQAEGAQQQAAALEAELSMLRQSADSSQLQASEQYEAQLQEAVTQIEANRGMELEMAEEQGERLRKENLALQRRLQGALAALAACGSPVTGPGGLAARMAQAAPEGNGRGAGGTPHDVALARARQAAAADDLAAAAAAAAAGGTTQPRSRSRFAEEAEAGGNVTEEQAAAKAPLTAPPTVPEERQQQDAAKPAPRPRGRPRKVAFAVPQQPQDEAGAVAAHEKQRPEEQQVLPAAAAAPAESRRVRRMTRAAAAAAPIVGIEPIAPEPAADEPAAAIEQAKARHGCRRTQAAPPAAEPAGGVPPVDDVSAAPQIEQQPKHGPAAPLCDVPEDEDVPLMASVTFEQGPAATAQAVVVPAAAVAKLSMQQRRRGRTRANKENSGRQSAQGLPGASKPSDMLEELAGGRRRKRLLPGAPMSTEMRAALGETEDSLSLRQHVAKKQAAGGTAPEAGGKRSRRQTQFFRL